MKKFISLVAMITVLAFASTLYANDTSANKDVKDTVAYTIDKVVDTICKKTGLAVQEVKAGFNLLAEEYKAGSIAYLILGTIMIGIAGLMLTRVLKIYKEVQENSKGIRGYAWEDRDIARTVVHVAIAIVCIAAGLGQVFSNLSGVFAPHYEVLKTFLK